jgi:hypothetical protein
MIILQQMGFRTHMHCSFVEAVTFNFQNIMHHIQTTTLTLMYKLAQKSSTLLLDGSRVNLPCLHRSAAAGLNNTQTGLQLLSQPLKQYPLGSEEQKGSMTGRRNSTDEPETRSFIGSAPKSP